MNSQLCLKTHWLRSVDVEQSRQKAGTSKSFHFGDKDWRLHAARLIIKSSAIPKKHKFGDFSFRRNKLRMLDTRSLHTLCVDFQKWQQTSILISLVYRNQIWTTQLRLKNGDKQKKLMIRLIEALMNLQNE